MDQESIIIEAKSLNKYFKENIQKLKVLENISFIIIPNEIISFIGPSGCGKTTLLNIISGIDTKYNGFLDNKLSDKSVSYMFQDTTLLPWRSVKDNLFLSLELKATSQEGDNYLDILKDIELAEYADNYPNELSGGMKRRLYLAQNVIGKPTLLLLDEPFTGLDYDTKKAMRKLLFDKKGDATIVMATHDIEDAILLSDRVIVLTRRPSTIKEIIDVSRISKRNSNYLEIENHIYSILDTYQAKVTL